MPRRPSPLTAEDVILQAVDSVVNRASVGISRAIADLLAARIDAELRAQVQRAVGKAGKGGRAPKGARAATAEAGSPAAAKPRAEIDRWVADKRARRVPNFVIEQTGLKTKKLITDKYGEDAVFEKGKPAPKPV